MSQTPDIKRLILCCDGTWQASDNGEENHIPTNVAKFCMFLNPSARLENGKEIQQITYYQPGIGSSAWTVFSKAIAGSIGLGLEKNVIAAYSFLINNYNPGDEIFCFGFSRGAYTARSIAGLISEVGILPKSALRDLACIYKEYQTRQKNLDEWKKLLKEKQKKYTENGDRDTIDANVKVCGVWDTVGALGIPQTALHGPMDANHKFHNPNISDKIENAFHALALDEHRAPFSPTLWHKDPESGSKTNLIQCWFPGVHSNVGGSTDLGKTKGTDGHLLGIEPLADDSLAWMIDLCSPFLSFNKNRLDHLARSIKIKLERDPAQYASVLFEDSYGWAQMPTGSIRRTPGQYRQKDNQSDPLHPSGFEQTREYMHVSVRYRYQNMCELWGWNRNQLSTWETVKKWATWSDADPLFELVEDKETDAHSYSSGFKWVKKLKNGSVVELPEMKVGNAGVIPGGYSFEEELVPKLVLERIKAGEESLLVPELKV